MNITSHANRIKTLRQSDRDFLLDDGVIVCPRAGFEISENCPNEYLMVLRQCINQGWIKPVAHMMDYEYTMDKLKDPQ